LLGTIEGDYRRGSEGSEAPFIGMKKGKAEGPTGVTSVLLQVAGMVGLRELTNITNDNIYREKISKDWKSNTTIPIYNGMGMLWNVVSTEE